MKKIISWNIRQGGGRRTPAITDVLLNEHADLVVLTEFRNNVCGHRIREALADRGGLPHQMSAAGGAATVNMVFLASRFPLTPLPVDLGAETQRYVSASCCGWTVVGLYFAQHQQKRPLFHSLLALPRPFAEAPAILIGDFNTGVHGVDEQGATFDCEEDFRALSACGWTDLWRAANPNAREFTWYSSRGNGFRIDHLLASPAALPLVRSVRYVHDTRRTELSDHAMLVAECDM